MSQKEAPIPRASSRSIRTKRLVAVAIGFIACLLLAGMALDTPIGHRLIADQVSKLRPASGLRITIGRIEGSIYGRSVLRDVELLDPEGKFLRASDTELDWRPFNWLRFGLDIRQLVIRGATLSRIPHFNEAEPGTPFLPDFNIRIDRLRVDRMEIDEKVMGEKRSAKLLARIDIHEGRALVRVRGSAGASDRVVALLDAEPDNNRFDVQLDYAAAEGGLLSAITGFAAPVRALVDGSGNWEKWDGKLLVDHGGKRLASFGLANRSGRYSVNGQLHPATLLTGIAKRAVGDTATFRTEGTFEDKVLAGALEFGAKGFRLNAKGGVDLSQNRFEALHLAATIADPGLLGDSVWLDGLKLATRLDGQFHKLAASVDAQARAVRLGDIRVEQPVLRGNARYLGDRWASSLDLAIARVATGQPEIDRRLVSIRAAGNLALSGARISSDRVTVAMPGLAAKLALKGDLKRGSGGITGSIATKGIGLPNLGPADVDSKFALGLDKGAWSLAGALSGRMARVDNPSVASLVGTNIRFRGNLSAGSSRPFLLEHARVDASRLTLSLSARQVENEEISIHFGGRHIQCGKFEGEAYTGGASSRADLIFAGPLPAGGIENLRLGVASRDGGWRMRISGSSSLGPFEGALNLMLPTDAPARLEFTRLTVGEALVVGEILFDSPGVSGKLNLSGSGLNGMLSLKPDGDEQAFSVALQAEAARLGTTRKFTVSKGRLVASGILGHGNSTIKASMRARNIAIGGSSFTQLRADVNLVNGRGKATGMIAGRRDARFSLRFSGDLSPERLAVVAGGNYEGLDVTMPRRAVLLREGKGWRLEPSQVNFGGGRAVASGRLNEEVTELDLALAGFPLSVIDAVGGDLGLGGSASGLIHFQQPRSGIPTGSVKLKVAGFTRSSMLVSSPPIDLFLLANLTSDALEARSVARQGNSSLGSMDARIIDLPGDGTVSDRVQAGRLFARLRYKGPADILWRLLAVEAFDITGPLTIDAGLRGNFANPGIRGNFVGSNLRIHSALTGTEVTGISVKGGFDGPRLEISSIRGKSGGRGTVTGAGTVDLSNLMRHGPGIDLRLAARGAEVVAMPDMAVTVSGPLRIVSDGTRGTIAGRLRVDKARWQLGTAEYVKEIPVIPIVEVNGLIGALGVVAPAENWRYLIDASADSRINVRGLGLDSEWAADVRLRGPVAAPIISGRAELVRGDYEFAGKRFNVSRGSIAFNGDSPPNPSLNIAAQVEESSLTANINIKGTALKPQITLSSTPSLPEEELLSRILFGNSVTDISAAEAAQLGAALASLRGGGGLDPINKLRGAIGLDRLRVVSADVATGRGTSIAAGKYITRRLYAEVVSDGQGYSASQLEFRITNWLSMLSSISSIGRESMNIKLRKDY